MADRGPRARPGTDLSAFVERIQGGARSARAIADNARAAAQTFRSNGLRVVTCAPLNLLMVSHGRSEAPPTRHNRAFAGVVLDRTTMRVLALPPPALGVAAGPGPVEDDYEVMALDDGTTLTLYHLGDDRWGMATANAYDASNLVRRGTRTFAEIFLDVAARTCPEFVAATEARVVGDGVGGTALFMRNIDPHSCYSVGFRHHDLHPLRADPERIWQVQSAPSGMPGMPLPSYGADMVRLPHVPGQGAHAVPEGSTVASLQAWACDSALRRACAEPAPDPPGGVHFLYGFVLRARDPGRGDVRVPSALQDFVRVTEYRPPEGPDRALISDERVRLHNIVRAILTPAYYEHYCRLFPDAAPVFARLERFIAAVSECIGRPGAAWGGGVLAVAERVCADNPGLARESLGVIADFVRNPLHACIIAAHLPDE